MILPMGLFPSFPVQNFPDSGANRPDILAMLTSDLIQVQYAVCSCFVTQRDTAC